MKNKTLTIILSATLIACIGVSIYQYNTTVTLKNSLAELTNTKNELTAEIESKTTELAEIASETEEMNNTISELTAKMDSLNLLAEEMQSEIESLEAPIEDTEEDLGLTQEEEDAIDVAMDEAIDKILEDYYKSNPQPTQGNYEHVGTPDNGVIPESTIYDTSPDGLSTDATVY